MITEERAHMFNVGLVVTILARYIIKWKKFYLQKLQKPNDYSRFNLWQSMTMCQIARFKFNKFKITKLWKISCNL